ncbi:MAG: glycosyltransferase family 4 protein [Chitinophagaceae bacterium]|nr:glycosyltransferase family 4 protein [Chitinophagaceae bacterium]
MSKEILHLCTDFTKQSIYNQLVTYLSKLGFEQNIYVPVRTREEIDMYRNYELSNVKYYYSYILKKIDRINYFGKIKKTSTDVSSNFDLNNVKLIHAHFLFSDGGNAYEINKKTGIPYIVAVRNTDINIFFKYFFHLRSHGINILKSADKIIFISNPYKDFLFKNFIPNDLSETLLKKCEVLPNGIDAFWLNNSNMKFTVSRQNWEALYVGEFTKNKNIHLTIEAINILIKSGLKIKFTIVGGGGDYEFKIRKLASKYSNWITLIERLNSKEELIKVYRKSDFFIMPSQFETFGLVYIEALSQGLPVIYTRGQGVDGYFGEGEVGYATKVNDINDLVTNINRLISNYDIISRRCNSIAKKFSWDIIANKYSLLYRDIIEGEINI